MCHKKLYKHLYKSLDRPSPLIVIEARLVRLLFALSGNRAPDWVEILANTHGIFNAGEVIKFIRRYERPNSQAGKSNVLFNLIILAFVIGFLMLLPLAAHTGAAISVTVAKMDMPAAEIVSYDGLSADIENAIAEITPASKDYSISHGLEKHGEAAQLVRDCMAKKGPAQSWQDPDGHRIQICALDNGQIGFQVEVKQNGTWKSITEYIKRYFHSLRDAANYMARGGAVLK